MKRLSGCVRRASDLTKKYDQGVSESRRTQLIIDISLNMSMYEMASATQVALTIALCACDGGASVWWINQLPQ